VTGVDWPEAELSEKVKVRKVVDGVEKEVEEIKKSRRPAHLEVVYHLYSMERRLGPVILRLRTDGRAAGVKLPSLTPVWRSCEFQEREIYDLFGIVFEGHPDLRRILMWEGFQDHPMRKDYVEPDDYDYEPTPHDDVLVKVHQRRPPSAPPS
jgi:NADH-quinone oxidoreductase subunit C